MKKLIVLTSLIASVWSAFSFASNQDVTSINVYSGMSLQTLNYTATPDKLVAPAGEDACLYFREIGTLHANPFAKDIEVWDPVNPCRFKINDTDSSFSNRIQLTIGATTAEPTQTCKGAEGLIIEGFHASATPFCANIGTTGGHNPEPLLCNSKEPIETPTGSNNFTHFVSAATCNAVTGPDGGSGEPTDPTDPTEPPPPATGGNPTTGTATTTGTTTGSDGVVTDVNTQTEIDFSPLTDRQNETNALLGGIKAALQANGQTPGTDTTGIESRLDTLIANTGTAADGEAAANNLSLPDIEQAIETGLNDIQDGINSAQNNQTTDQLENVGSRLTSFDSIPQIFQFATANCQPIPFGAHTLDLCGHAGTVSNVLAWLLTIMTIIFLVTSLNSDIKNIRMS